MAENETKAEKKQIEMSIWFVILLIVVIVFMCVFMGMNKKLGEAQEKITELTQTVDTLNAEKSTKTEQLSLLIEQVYSLSSNEMKAKLEEITGVETTEVPTEPSGEVAVISGEIAEEFIKKMTSTLNLDVLFFYSAVNGNKATCLALLIAVVTSL